MDFCEGCGEILGIDGNGVQEDYFGNPIGGRNYMSTD
jgi:hypothetical protein